MPGAVVAANPTVVMPWVYARSFQQKRTIANYQNRYSDGAVQTSVLVSSSRKEWQLSERLTASQLTDIVDFFTDGLGKCYEFWFYDVYETSPIFSYDETGVATVGRYAVRFNSPLQLSLELGRNPVQFSLIEIS